MGNFLAILVDKFADFFGFLLLSLFAGFWESGVKLLQISPLLKQNHVTTKWVDLQAILVL